MPDRILTFIPNRAGFQQTAVTADVAIIGGGIIGCACLYELARRGVKVILLEREGLASGASGACDGHICVQTKAPGLHSDLALEALDLYRSFPESFRQYVEFEECGSLLVACAEDECQALEQHLTACNECIPDIRPVTGNEARSIEPALSEQISLASYRQDDCRLDPRLATLWFAHQAIKHGAQIFCKIDVQGLALDAGSVTLQTSWGDITVSRVVIAGGAWTPQLTDNIGGPMIRPRRGEVLVTEAIPPLLHGLVISASYLARKFENTGDYVTPALEQTAWGNLLIGATREFVGFDRTVTPEALRELSQAAIKLVPALRSVNVIRSFAGLRPASVDGLPYLGASNDYPALLFATGHEGDGITLAPVTAKILADQILDGKIPDARLLPARAGMHQAVNN